jgi:hypothetical protein
MSLNVFDCYLIQMFNVFVIMTLFLNIVNSCYNRHLLCVAPLSLAVEPALPILFC